MDEETNTALEGAWEQVIASASAFVEALNDASAPAPELPPAKRWLRVFAVKEDAFTRVVQDYEDFLEATLDGYQLSLLALESERTTPVQSGDLRQLMSIFYDEAGYKLPRSIKTLEDAVATVRGTPRSHREKLEWFYEVEQWLRQVPE